MNVDWDAALENAAESPRAMLASWLEDADDIDLLVMMRVNKDDSSDVAYTWAGGGERDHAELIIQGLIEMSKHQIYMANRDMEETDG